MKELKKKGSLTIFAAICIVFSILGGMACIPAAKGMNGFWHMMFPQYVENRESTMFPGKVRYAPGMFSGYQVPVNVEDKTHDYTAPAQYVGPEREVHIAQPIR